MTCTFQHPSCLALQGDESSHSSLRGRVVALMTEREEDFAPFVEDDQSFETYIARMKKVKRHCSPHNT